MKFRLRENPPLSLRYGRLLPCVALSWLWPLLAWGEACTDALGPAEKVGTTPRACFCHRCAVVENHLYLIGGHGSGRRIPDVNVVTLGADGTLGAWRSTTPLPDGTTGTLAHAVAASGRFLYGLGGTYPDAKSGAWVPTNTVVVAKAEADGSLGAWQAVAPLPEARQGGAALAYRNILYYAGGQYERRVFWARIRENGLLEPWGEPQRLPGNRYEFALFAEGDYLYAVGGYVLHKTPVCTTFRAKILPDGTLQKWRRSEDLPVPLAEFGAAQRGRRMFLLGGATTDGVPVNSAYTALLDADNHFARWEALAPLPFPDGVIHAQALAAGEWLFHLGGFTPAPSPTGNRLWNTVYRWRILLAPPPASGISR